MPMLDAGACPPHNLDHGCMPHQASPPTPPPNVTIDHNANNASTAPFAPDRSGIGRGSIQFRRVSSRFIPDAYVDASPFGLRLRATGGYRPRLPRGYIVPPITT